MNRNLFVGVFLLGALAVLWVGAGYIASNPLALLMTAVIAAVYLAGAREILEFRRATATLATALEAIPQNLERLGDWLERLHPSLQNPVRLRLEGERTGLPGPALTPYLVGLLVMLGMLGTFLGMVVTLNGAVFALEGTTDLAAIRAALAAPVKGLGLAFGTSVAGVAASAMLGLLSALARRERLQTAQLLDRRIATDLSRFSLAWQRQETYRVLQSQAGALPDVVDRLQAMMERLERREQQLSERLLGNQESFHRDVRGVYTELADAVAQSLKSSLGDSARVAGDSIKPVVEAAMAGIAGEARLTHERVTATAQRQLDGLAERFGATADSVAATWTAALARQEQTGDQLVEGLQQALAGFNAGFEQRSAGLLAALREDFASRQAGQATADRQRHEALSESFAAMAATLHADWRRVAAETLAQQQQVGTTLDSVAREISGQLQAASTTLLAEITRLLGSSEELVRARIAAEADWLSGHGERMEQLAGLWRSELATLRDDEARRGDAAVERLGELQTALTAHLATLGAALEAPITRLIATASEAPRAAADVIGQMRQEMSDGIARDNALLEERSRIMATLNSLLDAINHASAEQRATIDALVASSTALLDRVGRQFAEQVDAESTRISAVAAQVSGSAVEVSSLGESFAFAVQLFNEANDKLIANLQRIEAAMDRSLSRSDEQLAYYVAQAREIIDLSIMSQKEVCDDLRRLTDRPADNPAALAAEAA